MTENDQHARSVVIIGGGPAAHRLVEAIVARDDAHSLKVAVIADESHLPYDRVALKGHGNWTTAYPRSAWTPARDLTFALDHIWEVLNDDDYLGT